ncbi:MAG TPA: DUF4395 domain-containing protein [Chitinophagaceae bacterium]|jgi:hypothetical protein|nr:DUF4395 domain-containing protein [Chitinophagaceae bacterium]
MKKVIKFGEDVEGYNIPVLNEREIRASAGILFVFMFISLMLILFKGNFLMIKYVIIVFLTDFIIRVLVNPKFSPSLIIGRLIVSRQVPEYVGAAQKKFAWKIGIVLASLMFFLLVVVNSTSIITSFTCLICLVFLFFESAFGICLGCLFYDLFYKEEAQYCAGEVCDVTKKQDIQKTSWVQILIIFGFIVYIILTILFFNDHFHTNPTNLWKIISSGLSN